MPNDEVVDNATLHDQQENIPSNNSGNRPFTDVLETNISRRSVMQGSLAMAAATFLAPHAMAFDKKPKKNKKSKKKRDLINFEPLTIAEATADNTVPSISNDYQYQVLIPWGTPLEPNSTEEYVGDPSTRPTAKQAENQIGIGHDGMWFFPEDSQYQAYTKQGYKLSNSKGMLCINHEFGNNYHVLGKSTPENLEDVRLSQSVHGVSVVALKRERHSHRWDVVASPNSRRITVNTPVQFSGPAAKSNLLQNPNGNIPLGTVNNCGSGPTPWGTYLTCEENFNGYFGATSVFTPTEEQARYGFSANGFGYGWQNFDQRFDLTNPSYVNESNRFGWIVEIDPFDGTKKPVKRTALGRFKHEAIAIAESGNGRIAAYMGDDQRFDYCYKFVSHLPWEHALEANMSPLDDGILYVAKFHDDGTGQWLPLDINESRVLKERFADQAELLINVRVAADLLGATPMDRPEWTTIGKDGEVYWTLTNNTQRTEPNAANPQTPNPDGHIIRTRDTDDFLGDTFNWEIFILASSTKDTEETFASPDAAWADSYGRLFVGTDGSQPSGLQDQLVVFDTTAENPKPVRLLTGVSSDEITGFTITPDQRTAFINIQHPGNGNPLLTNFPAETDGYTIPRDCTLLITRKDGGIIGS
jgi:secreted PhoX family phosphatase